MFHALHIFFDLPKLFYAVGAGLGNTMPCQDDAMADIIFQSLLCNRVFCGGGLAAKKCEAGLNSFEGKASKLCHVFAPQVGHEGLEASSSSKMQRPGRFFCSAGFN